MVFVLVGNFVITIEIHHNWCFCSFEYDPDELIALRKACDYIVAGHERSPAFIEERWDGSKTLFRKVRSKNQGHFPTGILSHVVQQFEQMRYQRVHIEDKRVYPKVPSQIDRSLLTFDPRDYQSEGGNCMLTKKRGVVREPTGAGKTKTMIGCLATLDLPTLWLTHEGHLARQTRDAIQEGIAYNPEVGIFDSKEKNIQKITVGLVQSICKRVEELRWWLNQIQVVILDECHHGSAKSWYSTVMSLCSPFRYGCSATPFERSDNSVLELMGCTGSLIYEKDAEEVREHLSRPYVEMIHMPSYPGVLFWTWPDIYKCGIVENQLRNSLIIDRAMISVRNRESCIIFVSYLEHGRLLEKQLSEEIGISGLHVFMSGSTPQQIRDEYFSRLKDGSLRVLIATDGVAGEGQDIPTLRRVIIGGGKKAAIIVKQRIGRGMRPDKTTKSQGWGGRVDIHDFVDNQHVKLLVHSDRRRGHYAAVSAIIQENFEHARYQSGGTTAL